jgi:hypothetical protein
MYCTALITITLHLFKHSEGFYSVKSNPETIRTWDLTYRLCARSPLYVRLLKLCLFDANVRFSHSVTNIHCKLVLMVFYASALRTTKQCSG